MATNSVENILSEAKDTLSKATKLTESNEGNPTDAFTRNEFAKGSYHIPHTARKGNPYA